MCVWVVYLGTSNALFAILPFQVHEGRPLEAAKLSDKCPMYLLPALEKLLQERRRRHRRSTDQDISQPLDRPGPSELWLSNIKGSCQPPTPSQPWQIINDLLFLDPAIVKCCDPGRSIRNASKSKGLPTADWLIVIFILYFYSKIYVLETMMISCGFF